MNQKLIDDALRLINEEEKYIIFYDGKAIKTNFDDGDCRISVNDYFDSNDFFKRKRTELEKGILTNVDYASTVHINNDVDLKMIHINKERKYLDYNIIVNDNLNVNITNIYYEIKHNIKVLLEILCEANCKVNLNTFINSSVEMDTVTNIYCLDYSKISLTDMFLNQDKTKHLANVFLLNNKAEAHMTNVIVNNSGKLQNYDYNIYHNANDTISTIKNYGIVQNESVLNFDNKGIIKKGAKASDLVQQTKGIILDLYSTIIATPILEIDENDVSANHGASIGAIDEKDLYYLMSRGLTREDSEALLVAAFISPYFRYLEDKNLSNYIFQEVNKNLYG